MLLADMRVVCDGGAAGLGRWRRAVEGGGLPRAGSGLGPLLDDAVSLRSAASMAIAFFGVRHAPEAARQLGNGVRVNLAEGVADLEVKRQENGQFGAG